MHGDTQLPGPRLRRAMRSVRIEGMGHSTHCTLPKLLRHHQAGRELHQLRPSTALPGWEAQAVSSKEAIDPTPLLPVFALDAKEGTPNSLPDWVFRRSHAGTALA